MVELNYEECYELLNIYHEIEKYLEYLNSSILVVEEENDEI